MNLEQRIKSSLQVFYVVIAVLAFASCEQQQPDCLISYDELKVMMEDETVMQNINIVDIRPREAWIEGFIEGSINIPFDTFIDHDHNLIDDGTALTSIMIDKDRTLIFYGSENEDVELFAHQAATLGYTDVHCYVGGIEDWKQHGDFLVITYSGFKAWHDAFCPFDDGENYLIDVNTKRIYIENGHIPGAINIVSNYFVTKYGQEASDITLEEVVLDKNAKVVFYCYIET